MQPESFVWTVNEVKLLLRLTLDYKASKLQDGVIVSESMRIRHPHENTRAAFSDSSPWNPVSKKCVYRILVDDWPKRCKTCAFTQKSVSVWKGCHSKKIALFWFKFLPQNFKVYLEFLTKSIAGEGKVYIFVWSVCCICSYVLILNEKKKSSHKEDIWLFACFIIWTFLIISVSMAGLTCPGAPGSKTNCWAIVFNPIYFLLPIYFVQCSYIGKNNMAPGLLGGNLWYDMTFQKMQHVSA